MSNIFLDRIDAVPGLNDDFSPDFNQWLANTVDTINEVVNDVQKALTIFGAPNYTATQIASLFSNGKLSDGLIVYDTTNKVYVGMQNNVLVKFTTTSYP